MVTKPGRLPFACSRRRLLPALVREAFVILDLVRGRPAARLADLGEMPDEELSGLRPIVNPAYEILIEGDAVWGRYRETGQLIHLFSMEDQESLMVFNCFDGRHRLDEASERLVQATGWDESRAFGHARDLFLTLAGNLVCLPKDPPQEQGSAVRHVGD